MSNVIQLSNYPRKESGPLPEVTSVLDFTSRLKAAADKRFEKECAGLPSYAVLCLACTTKWIAYVAPGADLFTLECPHCKATDSFFTPMIGAAPIFEGGPPSG